jgi:hypothetical protein
MNSLPGGASKPRWQQYLRYLLPIIIGVILIVAASYLFYNLGVDRGRNEANTERDAFYKDRINQILGTSTPDPNATLTPGPTLTPATAPTTLAKVDRVEGNRLTLLLLGPNGTPSGSTLVLTLESGTQVWRSVNGTTSELVPGDSIVFSGERNSTDGSFSARSVVVLPRR